MPKAWYHNPGFYFHFGFQKSWYFSVGNPGFARRGASTPEEGGRKPLLLGKIFAENYMKMKEHIKKGAITPRSIKEISVRKGDGPKNVQCRSATGAADPLFYSWI